MTANRGRSRNGVNVFDGVGLGAPHPPSTVELPTVVQYRVRCRHCSLDAKSDSFVDDDPKLSDVVKRLNVMKVSHEEQRRGHVVDRYVSVTNLRIDDDDSKPDPAGTVRSP